MRRLARTEPAWAVLAAFGTAYLVTGLVFAVLQLLLGPLRELELAITDRTIYLGGIPEALVQSVALACGAFGASFVARRAGGGAALWPYGGVLVATALAFVGAAAAEEQRLRGDFYVVSVFQVPLATAATFIPPLLALVLGAAMAGGRSERDGTNGTLEAAGAYALVAAIPAVLLAGVPLYALLLAPLMTPLLDALVHTLSTVAQSITAGALFAARGGHLSIRSALAFAVIGLAGVLHADVLPIWNTLFLDWTYVPLSLALVPAATALVAATAAFIYGRTRAPGEDG